MFSQLYVHPAQNSSDLRENIKYMEVWWVGLPKPAKKKVWGGISVYEGANESFTLYEHKGLNYSIFQNDVQIATFTRNRVKVGKGDSYEIAMNDDANLIVVVCLVLTVDASENKDNDSTITFDSGNIGPEDRPFDASWRPS